MAFTIREGPKNDHGIYYRVDPGAKIFWKKNEWHHVAVSWNAEVSRLFADGELVGEKSWEPALTLAPLLGTIIVGRYGEQSSSQFLIDELRITDTVTEKIEIPKTEYAPFESIIASKESGEFNYEKYHCSWHISS